MKQKEHQIQRFNQQMSTHSSGEMIKYYCYKLRLDYKNHQNYFAVLTSCLHTLTPKALLDTYKELRAFSYYKTDKWQWLNLDKKQLKRINEKDSGSFWLWLTAHPNGYIRELAWEKLVEWPLKRKVVFLLMTLNDNVPELRQMALVALSRLDTCCEEDWEYCLPFIQRLSGLGHKENIELQQRLVQVLLTKPKILLRAQQSEDVFIYRYAFELGFSADEETKMESIHNGLNKSDKVTLARSFKALIEITEHQEEQIRQLLSHPQTILRKLASEWSYSHLEKEETMIPRLLDSAKSIRYLIRDYVVKQFPDMNIRTYYHQHLETNEVTALQGLAMLRDPRDEEQMRKKQNDSRKKIRTAVLDWAVCLSPLEQVPLFYQGLADCSREVRQKAIEGLRAIYTPAIKGDIMNQFQQTANFYCQQSILNLLTSSPRKEYLLILFELYPCALNDAIQEAIQRRIQSWYKEWNRHFFVQFTAAEKLQLRKLLTGYANDSSEIAILGELFI
ncbi:hypothetical protein [Enterococcus sp. LJL51]|uniref:hypothetical protein n=1 Tax=Enterococcus sp. LJL51 TaxID=3416656 RepID=UPI003CF4E818